MRQAILSPFAEKDLRSIWLYSAKQWGRRQANTYLAEIQSVISKAAEKPSRGRACDDIRPGYFRILSGSHLIFYRLINDGIDVVRILHQSMDFQRHV